MSNFVCAIDTCPVILSTTCVIYQGESLIYTGINDGDSVQTALQKIDAAFADAGLGYAFQNGVIQTTPGVPVELGGALLHDTTIGGNYKLTLAGRIQASALITTGGTSSQFVKGDGSLDSTVYQPAGTYISALTGDGTAVGPGSAVLTLATVNANPGTYGSATLIPRVTVDAKGRVTAITTTAIPIPSGILVFQGDVSGTGTTGAPVTLTLATVNLNVYNSLTFVKLKVNEKGLVTGAAPVTNLDIEGALGYVPVTNQRTITINGVTQNLSANRSWTIAGAVATVTASAPLSSTGGANPNISITKANGSTDGYLSSADWTTFNNKQPALGYTAANDSLVVHLAGNETITGDKTFTGSVINDGSLYLKQDSVYGHKTGYTEIFSSGGQTVSFNFGVSGIFSSFTFANTTTTSTYTFPNASGTVALTSDIPSLTGYVQSTRTINTTSPLQGGGDLSANRTLSITQSGASTDGYLSSTDWNTFNNKQASGSYITALTGEATATGPGSAAVTLSTPAVTSKLLTGFNITGGSIAATDSILTAFGKVQNQINGLIGGTIYKGTWNATTNTPTLASGVGTTGWYYIVSVPGTTNIDGITDWNLGDWIIFDGTAWQQVDNTDAVVSVNGETGAVSLVSSDIPEGLTNLYYTDTRARAAISLTTLNTSGPATYDSLTGVLNIPQYQGGVTSFNTRTGAITLTSLDVTNALTYTPANDSNVVHKTGNETIAGEKTFSDNVLMDGDFYFKQNSFYAGKTGYNAITADAGGFFFSLDSGKTAYFVLSSIATQANYTLPNATGTIALTSDIPSLAGYVPTSRTLTINGTTYDLSANRSWTISTGSGTVTSVAALTIGTTGTDITSSVADGTTTPVITLNIPSASATARGVITTGAQTIAGTKTFSSSLISAGATFTSVVTINAVGADLILNRANDSNGASISFATDAITSWNVGLRNGGAENFYIYNQTSATNSLIIDNTTNSVKLSNTLSINGGVLAGNNIVSMRCNATGGQFRIEKSDGSLSAYPFYVGVDGTALAYYYNTAGALKVLLHTDGTSYFGNNLSVGYASYSATTYALDVNGTSRFTGAATFSSTITTANSAGSSINITTNGNNGTSGSPLQTNVNFYGYAGNLNGQIRVDDIAGTAQVGTMKFYTWNSGQVLSLTLSQTGAAAFSNNITASGYIYTNGNLGAANGNQTANAVSATLFLGNRGYFSSPDTGAATIQAKSSGGNWYSGTALSFSTNPGPDVTGTSPVERMVINSDGRIQAFVNGVNGQFQLHQTNSGYNTDAMMYLFNNRNATSSYTFAKFFSGYPDNTQDVEFLFRGDGLGLSDGGWTSPASDYAEYFESSNGQSLPIGSTVVLEDGKIRLATQSDTNIIGAIRPKNAALFLGNNAELKWNQKYLKDDFGAYILDEEGMRTLNPDYDSSIAYVSREKRNEWNIVGLVGQIPVLKDSPKNSNWVKMYDISSTVEMWLVK